MRHNATAGDVIPASVDGVAKSQAPQGRPQEDQFVLPEGPCKGACGILDTATHKAPTLHEQWRCRYESQNPALKYDELKRINRSVRELLVGWSVLSLKEAIWVLARSQSTLAQRQSAHRTLHESFRRLAGYAVEEEVIDNRQGAAAQAINMLLASPNPPVKSATLRRYMEEHRQFYRRLIQEQSAQPGNLDDRPGC